MTFRERLDSIVPGDADADTWKFALSTFERMEAIHADIGRLAKQVQEETAAAVAAGTLVGPRTGGQSRNHPVTVAEQLNDSDSRDVKPEAPDLSMGRRGVSPHGPAARQSEMDIWCEAIFAEPFANQAAEEGFVSSWRPSKNDAKLLHLLGPSGEALLLQDCSRILDYFQGKHMMLDRLAIQNGRAPRPRTRARVDGKAGGGSSLEPPPASSRLAYDADAHGGRRKYVGAGPQLHGEARRRRKKEADMGPFPSESSAGAGEDGIATLSEVCSAREPELEANPFSSFTATRGLSQSLTERIRKKLGDSGSSAGGSVGAPASHRSALSLRSSKGHGKLQLPAVPSASKASTAASSTDALPPA